MSASAAQRDDYDRFFQTTDTLEAQARRSARAGNACGRPVRLPSKLSAVAVDPSYSPSSSGDKARVYVSGSDGCVRRVVIGGGEKYQTQKSGPSAGSSEGGDGIGGQDPVDLVLRGPKAPLTCLLVVPVRLSGSGDNSSSGGSTNAVRVFAGGWDRCIWVWTVKDGAQDGEPFVFRNGHGDFVKCIALAWLQPSGVEILISGSADKSVVFWDARTFKRLAQFNNLHRTAITALLVEGPPATPAPTADGAGNTAERGIVSLLSAASDGEILETQFEVRTQPETKSNSEPSSTSSPPPYEATAAAMTKGHARIAAGHPATVYALAWTGDDDDPDLVTASADGTAKVLGRAGGEGREVDLTLAHGGHVRCVASEQAAGAGVYTGGRDEAVKLWDLATGRVRCTFEGHFDEVTGVAVVGGKGNGSINNNNGPFAVSVSLDGTVRIWDDEEMKRLRRRPDGNGEEEETGENSAPSMLTAEEEEELAALMDDDDGDG